jgi:hypothetical protein
MHPYVTLQLAGQRAHELRAAAERYRRRAPRRRRSLRHRAGWALVTIGLTLAYGSGDA